MSRALPTPPLHTQTLAQLQAQLASSDSPIDRSPREWFERARHEADLAVIAERKGKKEEMFLAYTRACAAYTNVRGHPEFGAAKKEDAHWAARVKDFKETYEAYLHKAKDMKEALKARDVEKGGPAANGGGSASGSSTNGDTDKGAGNRSRSNSTRSSNGPETTSMGSIADRMKALSGRGLDVGPTKKQPASAPPPASSSSSTGPKSGPLGPMSVTGGAGNFGPARAGPRDRAGSEASTSNPPTTSSTSPSTTAAAAPPPKPKGPSIPPKPHNLSQSINGLPSAPSESSSATAVPSAPTSPVEEKPNPNPVRPTMTGSSRRSSGGLQQPLSPHISGPGAKPITPHNSGPPPAGASRSPLPSIPQASVPPQPGAPSMPSSESVSHLQDFEKAFPSMSEFAKQFDDEPTPRDVSANGGGPKDDGPSPAVSDQKESKDLLSDDNEDEDMPKFPSLPLFANLPSVPTTLPSAPSKKPPLPPPPSRPRDLKPDAAEDMSPISPSAGMDLRRPASTPNVATLPGDVEDVDGPGNEAHTEDKEPVHANPALGLKRSGAVSRGGPLPAAETGTSPKLQFPTAKPSPVPPPSVSGTASAGGEGSKPPLKELPPKPKFPYTNSIEPELLRSYILHPSVNLLLLDVRSEEEYKKGYVGKEYEPKGYVVFSVWLDPTVIMRSEMTSQKLEDSLSLSPDLQRMYFDQRNKADLVVVYDASTSAWPRKGSSPTPLSRLWDIIYEHEFSKKLERTPVMLTGGYEAWTKFVEKRQARHGGSAATSIAGSPALRSPMPAGVDGRAYGKDGLIHGFEKVPGSPKPGATSPGVDSAGKKANRDLPVYQSAQYAKNISDSFGYAGTQSMTGESSYTGHQPSRAYSGSSSQPRSAHAHSHSHSHGHAHTHSSSSNYAAPSIPAPPAASIHPGPGARRRSDYVDHSQQSYSGYTSNPTSPRLGIDYPQAHSLNGGVLVPQPPPAVQGHVSDRQDSRPNVVRAPSLRAMDFVGREGDDVSYWNDVVLGLTGIKNMGNSCYMNSTLQCLSATYPFTGYFLDGSFRKSINLTNPLGTKGNLSKAFAELLKALWKEDYTFLSPVTFRKNIVSFAPQFSGSDQHDSQEFLSFVLDGLHEDLNRVKHKPPPVEMTTERENALETLPPDVASEKEWQIYKQRNDSFIVDLFQGQYRNRLQCMTCGKTSTTYDTFMYMSLPVPSGKKGVVVQELIDEFVNAEILDGDDSWNCPRCKCLRKATKTLTISRLPPVLLIQLKRFTTKDGVFWNKSETPVVFPINGLDLSRYVTKRMRQGSEDDSDPRTQLTPFKYDLYAVSNHMGTLSSGHYTAYVKSSKGWYYCDDSKITPCEERDVITKPAYILFYKRVRG